jgi:hypothetical protein
LRSAPYSVSTPDDFGAPTLEAAVGGIQAMVAGGTTDHRSDASVLVALNGTHLHHRSAKRGGQLVAHELPVRYPPQIAFKYQPGPQGTYILGPCSHDRTVSLAVSPDDSEVVAVSGWPSLVDNRGEERVWLSTDAGATFADMTGNLRAASGTIGRVRPSALLLVPLTGGHGTALLVGTVNGVLVSKVGGAPATWRRLGACAQLPLVLVAGLSYQPVSDTIVAATMGRGVYAMHGASRVLSELLG